MVRVVVDRERVLRTRSERSAISPRIRIVLGVVYIEEDCTYQKMNHLG